MGSYLLRRLMLMLLTLFGMSVLIFIALRLVPGNIADILVDSAGIVDKLFLFYAPRILAGTASVPFAGGAGFTSVNDAACVKSIHLHQFGEDFAIEGYLKDPYTR